MKLFLSFGLVAFFTPIMLAAQKYDNVWLMGGSNTPGITTHGGQILDFGKQPLQSVYHYRPHNLFTSNASISDSSGNLLFYTNGCVVAGANDEVLPNGDSINPGWAHTRLCEELNRGYGGGYSSVIILPKPNSGDSIWYVFHKPVFYVGDPPTDGYHDKVLYTEVVKSGSSGNLYVRNKNIEVINTPLSVGEFIAVKHADGARWWLVTPLRNSNTFLFFRFDSSGVAFSHEQTIGNLPPLSKEGYGQMSFNHQGTKMARYFPEHPFQLFDFDRLSGFLSNPLSVQVNYDPISFEGGCCFSPNGRFLYLTAVTNMYQFDLETSDISASQVTVETWDGFKDPIGTTFNKCQLGPDCKIYIDGPDLRYYHVIHQPDLPGLACEAEQRGLVMPTPIGPSLPYFPNYRLGPPDNPGPPCTATVSVQGVAGASGAGLKVFPNPASQMVYLDYRIEGGEARFELWNTLGQVIKSVSLNAADNFGGISTAELPGGMYVYRLMVADKLVQSGSLSIQR